MSPTPRFSVAEAAALTEKAARGEKERDADDGAHNHRGEETGVNLAAFALIRGAAYSGVEPFLRGAPLPGRILGVKFATRQCVWCVCGVCVTKSPSRFYQVFLCRRSTEAK